LPVDVGEPQRRGIEPRSLIRRWFRPLGGFEAEWIALRLECGDPGRQVLERLPGGREPAAVHRVHGGIGSESGIGGQHVGHGGSDISHQPLSDAGRATAFPEIVWQALPGVCDRRRGLVRLIDPTEGIVEGPPHAALGA
jgi:hypothetical protein